MSTAVEQLSLADLARVNVVGVSGSGKSTFATQLADVLGSLYIEMDRLYHKPNWQEPTAEEFAAKVTDALKPERWVLDGNYHSKTWQTKWSRATAIIWVNPSFSRTMTQAFGRAVKRIRTKKELWPGTGNRETFRKTFLSRESVLLWTLTSYHRVQQRYSLLMADRGEFNDVPFLRLQSRKSINEFLQRVRQMQDEKFPPPGS